MSLCVSKNLSEVIWSHLKSFEVMMLQNLLCYKSATLLKNALSFFGQSVLQTSDTVGPK
jgi:hypothetical protein